MEVPGGVTVLRGIAAANVAAGQALAQMHPGIAQSYTLGADVSFRRDIFAVGEVFAECHLVLLLVRWDGTPQSDIVADDVKPDAIKSDAGKIDAALAMRGGLHRLRADN